MRVWWVGSTEKGVRKKGELILLQHSKILFILKDLDQLAFSKLLEKVAKKTVPKGREIDIYIEPSVLRRSLE